MRRAARPARRALIGVLGALSALPAAHAAAAEWSSLAPSAHPRSEGTFVVHDSGAFHLNGFDADIRVQNSVERYDIAADTWETTGSPGFPTARTHNGTVVVDGELWLIGGRVGGPRPITDSVVVFDLETQAWRDGPTLPVPFAGGGAALLGRRVHVFGGLDAEARCDVDTHLVHDLDAPEKGWRDLSGDAPFPRPRNHFGTAVMDGRIHVVGGQIGHDDCDRLVRQREQTPLVHVYDPGTGDWDRLADLPWSQSHAEPSTFVHAGRLWSVGGMVNGDRVLSYDTGADAWTWRDDLTLPNRLLAPGARIFHGNRLHMFGGGVPDVRDPRTATWVSDVSGLDGAPPVNGPFDLSTDDGTPSASRTDTGGSGGGVALWLAALLVLRFGTDIATRRESITRR